MRAAVVEKPGVLVVRQVPQLRMNPWQALVRIEACSICNHTDAEILAGRFGGTPYPLILGHESAGRVIQVGERVSRYRVGDQVLRPGAMYEDPTVGIASAWGGFAEYGLVGDVAAFQRDRPAERPHWSWEKQQVIPTDIEPGEATAIITLKETLSLVKLHCPPGTRSLAIVGTGPVGRSFAFWARHLGLPIIAVYGRREKWRDEMLRLGATHYIVAGDRSPVEAARAQGLGPFERAIEAVGSLAALETALSLVGSVGQVAPYGILPPASQWPAGCREALEKGIIRSVPVDESVTHEEVLRLIAEGRVRLADWISHRLPLARIAEGFRLLENKEATKVVIEM